MIMEGIKIVEGKKLTRCVIDDVEKHLNYDLKTSNFLRCYTVASEAENKHQQQIYIRFANPSKKKMISCG